MSIFWISCCGIKRGVWGDPPPILGHTCPPGVRMGVWGDPLPILGHTWPPGVRRGVWGDPPPILGHTWPHDVKRGVWGDPPPILGHTWPHVSVSSEHRLGVCRTCGCRSCEACNCMRHIYLIYTRPDKISALLLASASEVT